MAKITRKFWIIPGEVDKEGRPVEHAEKPKTFLGMGVAENPFNKPVEVTEEMTEDGEYVQSMTDPLTKGTVEIARGVDKARLDLYQARQKGEPKPEDPNKAPETIKTDDGRTLQWDGGKKAWVEIAPAAKPAPAKPTVIAAAATDKTSRFIVQQMPDGQVRRVPNPNYDPAAAARETAKEKQLLTAGEMKAKRDEVDLAYMQGKITREQRDSEFDQWYKTRLTEHQERQAELANRREDRMVRAEERAITTEERRARTDQQRLEFDQQSTAMTSGLNRVKTYLDTMPYRVGPNYAANFAAGVNTLSRGGGPVNFTAEDFQVQIPDLDRLAEEGTARALAVFQGGVPAAVPGAIPSGADVAAPPPAPIFPQVPDYIPPQRRWPVPV